MQKNIASEIVSKFGGAYSLAEIIDMDASQIYRWTYPITRGGTGGKIPTKHQQTLLTKAKELGIDLKPDDFFDLNGNHKPKTSKSNTRSK